MTKLTIGLATATALAAVALSAAPASAHGSHHFFRNHHPHLYFYAGPPVRDCSFYREMWEDTGLLKWKRRYYACKGWW